MFSWRQRILINEIALFTRRARRAQFFAERGYWSFEDLSNKETWSDNFLNQWSNSRAHRLQEVKCFSGGSSMISEKAVNHRSFLMDTVENLDQRCIQFWGCNEWQKPISRTSQKRIRRYFITSSPDAEPCSCVSLNSDSFFWYTKSTELMKIYSMNRSPCSVTNTGSTFLANSLADSSFLGWRWKELLKLLKKCGIIHWSFRKKRTRPNENCDRMCVQETKSNGFSVRPLRQQWIPRQQWSL